MARSSILEKARILAREFSEKTGETRGAPSSADAPPRTEVSHLCARKRRFCTRNRRFCSGFAAGLWAKSPLWRKSMFTQRLTRCTLLYHEATEVSPGVHAPASRTRRSEPALVVGFASQARETLSEIDIDRKEMLEIPKFGVRMPARRPALRLAAPSRPGERPRVPGKTTGIAPEAAASQKFANLRGACHGRGLCYAAARRELLREGGR